MREINLRVLKNCNELASLLNMDFYTREYVEEKLIEEKQEAMDEIVGIGERKAKGKLVGKSTVRYIQECFDVAYWKAHQKVLNIKSSIIIPKHMQFAQLLNNGLNEASTLIRLELLNEEIMTTEELVLRMLNTKLEEMIGRMMISTRTEGKSYKEMK